MPSASELLTISSEWTQSTGRQSRDGLIWLTPNMSTSQEVPANLFRRGPRALILKGEHNPGIIAWSLDHHVLSMPLYQNPEHDIPDIYRSHRAMLDRYQEFVMPYYQPTSAIDTDWEVLLTPPFMKHWQSAHEQHCRSLGSNYVYKASLTGNVVRAIQADKYRDSGKGISGNVQPHALHQVIAEHYKCLDADFCQRISINHPGMTSTERTEGFAAWEEAAREYKATHPEASVGWNSQGAMARLRHYPAQFSVDGAIMVTVPVAVVDYPKKASDILRGLEFFETRTPGSISETSDGNIEIQLPLLLIKEQAQRIDDNGSGEEDSEEAEEEEDSEEELDIEGDSDEEEEEEGVPRHSTRNAQRIVIASAAWYLSRLQIEDFPVFGLVTCGEKGYLSQAWVSSRDNCCYVVDWNIQNDPFDLGSGSDRYSAFLSKLANHGQELESRFEGVRDQLLALAMSDDASILHWSTRAQLKEYEVACEDEDY